MTDKEALEKLKQAKREAKVNFCNVKVGVRELVKAIKALEKVISDKQF